MEEESANWEAKATEEEEASGNSMAIEAVLRNGEAWDDVKSGWKERETTVRDARMEEVDCTKSTLLWDEVSRTDALGTGSFRSSG